MLKIEILKMMPLIAIDRGGASASQKEQDPCLQGEEEKRDRF